MKQKIATLILIVVSMLFIVSASVAVPLECRPFYYAHVDALHMEEETPWTRAEIIEAFDDMMDFCMGDAEFKTGVLKYSEDGKAHFADCAVLFKLDIHVLMATTVLLIVALAARIRGWKPYRFLDKGPLFWAGSVLSVGFLVIAFLCSLDFDAAFVTFHHLFFPGKTNWVFYYDVDEIINVLPEVFFMDCAILIVVILFALCIAAMIVDRIVRRKYY